MSEAQSPTAPEPHALIAIEHSAQLCARAFPYLSWRYGATGVAGLRDDNAQIMSVALNNPELLSDQIEWVRRQGAARGLPSWMFEVDLECMARSAQHHLPEHPALSTTLRSAAESLAARRHAVLGEGKFRRIATDFQAKLGGDPSRLWRGFGCLLASAVADERNGDMKVVKRLSGWATNPRSFGDPWRSAVEHCIYSARRV